ncbi:MAG: serine hydrolase [Bacteroidales bacterium]|nr:serine hydrolase [Bacteroidales bacterium]MBP8677745.1 serine hydrolase [Bacteroidales bacterium]MBP9977800.1 serine hydrolase [Bacteroidales bacterium]
MKNFYLFLSIFLVSVSVIAQPLKRVSPQESGMDPVRLSQVDRIIEESIKTGEIPGAVLAVVRDGKMAYLKAYGNKSVYPSQEKMTVNTVFDLASVSKPVGTAIAFMQLVEQGRVRLTDNVSMYIPGFKPWTDTVTGRKIEIRVVDLLTHTSGLPPYAPVATIVEQSGAPNPTALMSWISNCKRDFKPTSDFQYSCLNFVTLQNILQNITGMKLMDYSKKNVFDVLGMKNTTYNPSGELLKLVAPTEKQKDGSVLLGRVHDPIANILNDGNSGNAGVFSNAEDLAILAAALMNGGEYNGKRVLGKLTLETMTRVPAQVMSEGRSLGWDNFSSYASNNGNLFHPDRTFGHTGYTGTSFIVDPVSKTAVILLAHRVHPVDKGSVVRLRALVANAVAGSVIK